MSLYLDSSALIKLYVQEADSEECTRLLDADPKWYSGRHAMVEVRRNLSRRFSGHALAETQAQFELDWARVSVVELDGPTCALAAQIAESTGARTLDALHLGAAERVRRAGISFLTYDVRQAHAARSMGWTVLGA